MKKILAAAVLAGIAALAPGAAGAQERAGDAAMGAVSGAVVLGPVGAVAGAVVGYTAGPSIARAWRLHHRPHYAAAPPRRHTHVVATAPVRRSPAAEPREALPPPQSEAPPAQTLE